MSRRTYGGFGERNNHGYPVGDSFSELYEGELMSGKGYTPPPPIQLSDKVVEITYKSAAIDPLLFQLFEQPTPHGHEKLLHDVLPFMGAAKPGRNIEIDKMGNIIVDVGNPKTDFRSVFSCHMDTVHNLMFKDSMLRLKLTSKKNNDKVDKEGLLYASVDIINEKTRVVTEAPCVLGGDDKVGVYILCRMIEKGIPGRYMFHVGEEKGCIGSKFIARDTPDRLKHMRRAIAFDRAGYTDVIAFQRSQACSSENFSKALATALNEAGSIPPNSKFTANVRGVWTDTAEYMELVSECCNLSVGYFNNHGSDEYVDVVWLEHMLLPAILKVDWEKLPTERDKTPKPVTHYHSSQQNFNYTSGMLTPEELKEDTPLWKVPAWIPSDGWNLKAGPVGMKKLIAKWLCSRPYNEKEQEPHVLTVVDMVADLHNAKLEIAHLRKAISEKHDAPRFKISYRMGMIESLQTTWNKMLDEKVLNPKLINLLASNPIQMTGLSDDDSKTLLKMVHVKSQFRYLESKEFYRIKLGLDIDAQAQIRVNKLFVETVLAISNFANLNKRLKKQIRTATLHMKHNSSDPVFSKLKDVLDKYSETDPDDPAKAKPASVMIQQQSSAPKPPHKCANCKDTGLVRKPVTMPNQTILMTLVSCPICFPIEKKEEPKPTLPLANKPSNVTTIGSVKTNLTGTTAVVANEVQKPTVH